MFYSYFMNHILFKDMSASNKQVYFERVKYLVGSGYGYSIVYFYLLFVKSVNGKTVRDLLTKKIH